MSASFVGVLVFALLSAPVMAEGPIGSEPVALQPGSRTARAITGPIIISDTRVVFGTGSAAELTLMSAANTGPWELDGSTVTAQVFRLQGNIGELLNGNTICGDREPRFVVAHEAGDANYRKLSLTYFDSSETPTGIRSPGLCGTYNYDMDRNAWREADLSEDPATPLGAANATQEDSGKWIIRRTINPVDDTPTVILSLQADSGHARTGRPVEFNARCQSNKTEVFVRWHDYVGDDSHSPYEDFKYVTVRVGNSQARDERWGVSTSNDATFAPGWTGNLLKEMLGAEQLVLRLTPYGENPVTAIFNTRGLEAALAEFAATCNWSF